MKKIVSLFARNYEGDRLVRDEIVPGAEWVVAGEGVATQKFDGVCVMVRGGRLYKRHELKPGKTPPPDWEAADEVDPETGKQMGWVPARAPDDRHMLEAFERFVACGHDVPDEGMTCEFLGPKSQGNVEGFPVHILAPHDWMPILVEPLWPRTFEGLRRAFIERDDIEGVVWHHPDGRMVKIKAKDFGLKRRPGAQALMA